MLLKSLEEKPMHGYGIIKTLGEEFGGFSQPSAGAVYPMLQALEDQEYVIGEEKKGKRVYSITPQGKELLRKEQEIFKATVESRRAFIDERSGLNRELRNFANLIRTNYRDLTTDKAEKIRLVLQETRKEITGIIFE
jgi:DNA-binding PadR family transcriptional regulator